MSSNRRGFIEQLGAVATLGALPADLLAPRVAGASVPPQSREWDLTWTDKLSGIKHKALYDCTEIESGNGVARAGIWETQYQQVLGAKPAEIKTVLILRHVAVALALRQDVWDKFEIGKTEKVKAPQSEEITDWNPALTENDRGDKLGSASDRGLTGFIAHGGIVIACNLALQKYVRMYRSKDGVDNAEAQRRAVAGIVPGITLQPSGVFAAVMAGQAGCVYVKAS